MRSFETLRNTGLKAGIVGLALVGCGETSSSIAKSEPATVIETEFIPEHTILVNGMCILRSQGVCMAYQKKEETVPDSYIVTLEQCEAVTDSQPEPDCNRDKIEFDKESYELAKDSQTVFYTAAGTLELFNE